MLRTKAQALLDHSHSLAAQLEHHLAKLAERSQEGGDAEREGTREGDADKEKDGGKGGDEDMGGEGGEEGEGGSRRPRPVPPPPQDLDHHARKLMAARSDAEHRAAVVMRKVQGGTPITTHARHYHRLHAVAAPPERHLAPTTTLNDIMPCTTLHRITPQADALAAQLDTQRAAAAAAAGSPGVALLECYRAIIRLAVAEEEAAVAAEGTAEGGAQGEDEQGGGGVSRVGCSDGHGAHTQVAAVCEGGLFSAA